MKRHYSSTRSNAARKIAGALLPCPCFRCGRLVTADMKWNADHPIARVDAEAQGIPQHEQDRMVVPSHSTCDARAGAELGNKLRAQAKTQPRPRPVAKVERPKLKPFSGEPQQSPGGALHFLSPDGPQEAL